jgi:hypothetical protein
MERQNIEELLFKSRLVDQILRDGIVDKLFQRAVIASLRLLSPLKKDFVARGKSIWQLN